MEKISLENDLYLAAEPDNKRIRLIIYNGDTELACRKAHPKEISRFLASDEEILFKGRLRLLKDEDKLIIFMNKHDIAGKTDQRALIALIGTNLIDTN